MATTARPDLRAPARPARADAFASLCLVAAGLAGVLPLVVPWIEATGATWDGWSWLVQVRSEVDPSLTSSIGAYGLLLAALAGGGLFLFGVGALLPVNHRPFGTVGVLLALMIATVTVWWLVRIGVMTGGGSSALMAAGLGWWCLPLAALLGLLGSIKALATG